MGTTALGIWLILFGLAHLIAMPVGMLVLALLAFVAGILLITGK